MKAHAVATVIVISWVTAAPVYAEDFLGVPGEFWEAPLIVRRGIHEVGTTVGGLFRTESFAENEALDGSIVTAEYGQVSVRGNDVVLEIVITRDGEPEVSIIYNMEYQNGAAYLASVEVENFAENIQETATSYQEKIQMVLFTRELTE